MNPFAYWLWIAVLVSALGVMVYGVITLRRLNRAMREEGDER